MLETDMRINWLVLPCAIALALNGAWFVFPNTAHACSCVADYSHEQAFDDAEAVFVGRVLAIDEHRGFARQLLRTIPFLDNRPSYRSVAFHVTERWKGVDTNLVTVATGFGGGDCGFLFAEGETYLVYAHDGDFYGEELATGICSHTEVLRHSEDAITALGPGNSLFSDEESVYDPTNDTHILLWMLGRPTDTIRDAHHTVLTGPWYAALAVIALYLTPPITVAYWLIKRHRKSHYIRKI
jgi:hypothetical protein